MTITATTLEGTGSTLTDADIDNLRRSMRGELVVAGEARYDEARRVWNGNVDRRPALIVRCLGAADVQGQLRAVTRGPGFCPRRRPQRAGARHQ